MRPSSLLALSIALLAACHTVRSIAPGPTAREPGRLTADVYFPLTANSSWTYRIHDLVRKRTYLSETRVAGRRFIPSLRTQGVIVEEQFVGDDSTPFLTEEAQPTLYFKNEGYLHRVFLNDQDGRLVGDSGSSETHFLPVVFETSSRWESVSTAFEVGGAGGFGFKHRHAIQAQRAPVSVPAGVFDDCIRVDTLSIYDGSSRGGKRTRVRFHYSDWYAPSVGLVRSEQRDPGSVGNARTRIDLVKYSIGPATE